MHVYMGGGLPSLSSSNGCASVHGDDDDCGSDVAALAAADKRTKLKMKLMMEGVARHYTRTWYPEAGVLLRA